MLMYARYMLAYAGVCGAYAHVCGSMWGICSHMRAYMYVLCLERNDGIFFKLGRNIMRKMFYQSVTQATRK